MLHDEDIVLDLMSCFYRYNNYGVDIKNLIPPLLQTQEMDLSNWMKLIIRTILHLIISLKKLMLIYSILIKQIIGVIKLD